MFNSVTEGSIEMFICTWVQVFFLRNKKSSNGLPEHAGKSLTTYPLFMTTAIFFPTIPITLWLNQLLPSLRHFS